MSHPLLDLNQFVTDHPPRIQGDGQWREGVQQELFLHAGTRIRIAIDQARDIGFGVWRDDELAKAGIFAPDADSHAFAERLVKTLGPELSIRNLEHLVQAFSRELAQADAARLRAAAS